MEFLKIVPCPLLLVALGCEVSPGVELPCPKEARPGIRFEPPFTTLGSYEFALNVDGVVGSCRVNLTADERAEAGCDREADVWGPDQTLTAKSPREDADPNEPAKPLPPRDITGISFVSPTSPREVTIVAARDGATLLEGTFAFTQQTVEGSCSGTTSKLSATVPVERP